MSRFRNLSLAVAVGAAALAALQSVPADAVGLASATPPHIVANPNNLMVNTKTKLKGTGFTPNSTLTVQECSTTRWTVPANPCNTTNTIHVQTNAKGNFKHSLTAQVCPRSATAPPGFSQICYVGVPTPTGLDQEILLGAAKITVTGP